MDGRAAITGAERGREDGGRGRACVRTYVHTYVRRSTGCGRAGNGVVCLVDFD